MHSLSSPVEQMKERYTVVVIGSGYGGGIAASRMARAGQSVCLLERGREIRPGEYPSGMVQAAPEIQLNTEIGRIGSDLGMFEFHVNDDVSALVGCGLGGTSLINANVSLRLDRRVFDDPAWPEAFRGDIDTLLEEGYARAETMLGASPYPDDRPLPAKARAHKASAESIGHGDEWYKVPLNVTWQDGVNHVGVEQRACIDCGDCVTGCNHRAKNTTLMNYLPDARNHGAEIFTQCAVRRIAKDDDGWVVHFDRLGVGREEFADPEMTVRADIVVLSAGALGSTEILLRSREYGLDVSDMLGRHFTGNGDALGFGYNTSEPVNGIGLGDKDPEKMDPVGPCITSVIDLRGAENVDDGFVMEEGSIPAPLAPIQPLAQGGAAGPWGREADLTLGERLDALGREAVSFAAGPYHGAIQHSQTYLVMSHDDSDGTLRLVDDRIRIEWPNAGRKPIFQKVNEGLEAIARGIGGTYVENPMWGAFMGRDLVTVHPLGGCVMGEDGAGGVVNHKGQLFAGSYGTDVHQGLYVTDGSVLPRSVGVNPLLTISAVTERSMALLAEDRGWTIDYVLPSSPRHAPDAQKKGIRFTEAMKGWFSINEKVDYAEGKKTGEAEASPMSFAVTVTSDDLDDMVADPRHPARIYGTVTAPILSADPMTVHEGRFQLFVENPEKVDVWNMTYSMKLMASDGRARYFHGYKVVDRSSPLAIWPQTTTLYVTVYDGESRSAPVIGKGMLHIKPIDFMRQLRTMRVTNAETVQDSVEGLAAFGKLFAGTLFEAYGGILIPESRFAPDAPPRRRRRLDAPIPEIVPVGTGDGVAIRLTRYAAGSKGPVLLAHGAGYSGRVFSTDLPNANLVEYLSAHGYDVWVLDYRASTRLPSAAEPSNLDLIARHDWTAAVKEVLAASGADGIQVVAHCAGSQTFLMALIEGLEGVRSGVCSQVGLHPVAPAGSHFAAMLRVPQLLEKVGVSAVTAYTDEKTGLGGKLLDTVLGFMPTQQTQACNSAVCHRVTALYGPAFAHDNLTQRTHDHLHEIFGEVSMPLLSHVADMVRVGHLLSAEGEDVYMPRLERLALPLHFIHGDLNKIYLPEGTERTVSALSETNGAELYGRTELPGYGHLDPFIGAHAVRDVFPTIVEALERQG